MGTRGLVVASVSSVLIHMSAVWLSVAFSAFSMM
jgi:hypothetical protein